MSEERRLERARALCSEPARLIQLVEKYRLLAELKRAEPGRTLARRDAMRAVAERFPAAMREWDEATLDEIERRGSDVARVLDALAADDSGAVAIELLMQSSCVYIGFAADLHERLRAALAVKRWLGGRAVTDEIAVEVERRFRFDRARLDAIAEPEDGRLTESVYREVAALHGVTSEAVKAALFVGHGAAREPRSR